MSTYTEQVGCEGPSRLQTQVHVGGIDEGTAAKTNEQSTYGKNVVGLVREIVEGLEGIDGEVVQVLGVQRLDALDFKVLLVVASEGRSVECILLLREHGAVLN